jgi:molybdate transport system permease protein
LVREAEISEFALEKMNWHPIILTLELAMVTTLVLLLIGLPLAWWLAHTRFRGKPVVETLLSMPLILPPTVIGFYLLVALSPMNGFGRFLNETLGLQLVFTFPGLVLASVIYSLPFMISPLQSGLESLPKNLREAAFLLGKSKLETLWFVELPNIRANLLTAVVLTFAHTMGEFGLVLMIGGNLPSSTRVASIEVWDRVERMDYPGANAYALILIGMAFAILLLVFLVNKRGTRKF